MIRAKAHLTRNEVVGILPRRRCLLCLAGEHDLDGTFLITAVGPGGEAIGRFRSPRRVHRSKKADRLRAEQAKAIPAGTAEQQRVAAGVSSESRGR
jgi:hypothetical protein